MPTLSPSSSLAVLPDTERSSSCRVSIENFTGRIVGPVDVLADLRALLPAMPANPPRDAEETRRVADFVVVRDETATKNFHIVVDGERRWTNVQRCELVPLLEWALTTAAVERLGETHLLFHAGAVACRERGLLLPAISGSGKTTLTAALVAEGFRLCSDEIGVIDRATGHLLPFPKRLCVKEGGRAALAARYPQVLAGAACHRRGSELAWYVEPPGEIWATAPVPVRHVVFPRYVAGSRTTIEPIARSAALPLLLAQSFSARRLGSTGVERAVALLRDAECYALTVGDLAAAIAHLRGLYDRPSSR